MEGQEYITVNPDTLLDTQLWSYRDIQKLCVKLNLGGKGRREDLVRKLENWHRIRDSNELKDSFEMNVMGNNFSLLQVKVRPCQSKKRKSTSMLAFGSNENGGVVSPTLLRPLTKESCTPGKSILKKRDTNIDEDINAIGSTSRKSICFSPFNGVKVIRNRNIFSGEL